MIVRRVCHQCVYCLHCCKPDERIRESVLDILSLPSIAEDEFDTGEYVHIVLYDGAVYFYNVSI